MRKNSRSFTIKLAAGLTLVVVLAVTTFSSVQMLRLETRYALAEFLAKDDPAMTQDQKIRRRYQTPETSWVIVIIRRQSGWLETKAIQALGRTTDQIGTEPGVKSVASLGSLETIVHSKDGIHLGRLTDVLAKNDWKNLIANSGVAAPVLISKDATWATMLIEMDDSGTRNVLGVRDSLIVKLNASLKDVSVDEILIGGVPVVQAELTDRLGKEIAWLGTLSVLAATLALTLLFSGLSALLIAGTATVVANVSILGALAFLGQGLGVLSVSLPILISVQALSLAIHSLVDFIDNRKSHDRWQSLVMSFRRLLLPNLLVSLVVAFGFTTLAISKVTAMSEFGITVAAASVSLWLLGTAVTFSMLAFLPEPKLRGWVAGKAKWPLVIMKRRRPILAAVAVAMLISAGVSIHTPINFSHRLLDDLTADTKTSGPTATMRSATAATVAIIDESLGGLVPVEIDLRLADQSWMEPQNREKLTRLVGELRAMPFVGSVLGPADLFSIAGASFSDKKPQHLAEIQTLFELAAHNPLRHFMRDDGQSVRLSLRLKDRTSHEVEATLQAIGATIAKVAPQAKVAMGGWGTYVHRMNRELSSGLLIGLWEALAVIFALMVIVFRSFRWAIVSVIPNLLPPLFLLGAISALRIEVKPGLAIVFAVALGFAFNNTVYLLKRVREIAEKMNGGLVSKRVIERAFWHEGQACLLSSLTLVVGFFTLCLSDFSMTRGFGMAMVFSMFAGIIGDLVLLPAFLRQWPQLLQPKLKNDTAIPALRRAVVATSTAASLAITLTPVPASPATDLSTFARSAAAVLFAKDESAKIRLINIETDGEMEERKVEIKRLTAKSKSGSQQKIVAKILEPKSLKGTAVLTSTDGKSQNRWIYIPSSQQVRRVVGGEESGAPILGTELSTEDLDLGQVDGAKASIVSSKDGRVTIESKIPSGESAYSKCTAIFDESSYLLQSADCFDKKGAPAKRIEVVGYRKLKGGVARPTEMKIVNLKTKRMTRLVFENHKVDVGLKPRDFTPEALRD